MFLPDPLGFLIDLDGTLYADGGPVPGAVEALARLRDRGRPFRLVTNTSSRSRAMLVQRLQEYGFDVAPSELFTAPMAAAALAAEAGWRRVVPLVPEPALADLAPLELAGGTSGIVAGAEWRADAVLVGDLGERWTHALMQEAFEHLCGGAALLAVSRDRYWRKDGRLTLDAGPFVAGLEYASGRAAIVAGKPSPRFFAGALASLGTVSPREVAMVGDDVWSDVGGAQGAGLQGWLVQTGKYRREAAAAAGITPDRVIHSVAALAGA